MDKTVPFEQAFQPNSAGVYDIADVLKILEKSQRFEQYRDVDIDNDDEKQDQKEVKNFLDEYNIEYDIFRNYVYRDLNYTAQYIATAYADPVGVKKLLCGFYEV